jgi:hypothetical protein
VPGEQRKVDVETTMRRQRKDRWFQDLSKGSYDDDIWGQRGKVFYRFGGAQGLGLIDLEVVFQRESFDGARLWVA